jgi:hypothetical protein
MQERQPVDYKTFLAASLAVFLIGIIFEWDFQNNISVPFTVSVFCFVTVPVINFSESCFKHSLNLGRQLP